MGIESEWEWEWELASEWKTPSLSYTPLARMEEETYGDAWDEDWNLAVGREHPYPTRKRVLAPLDRRIIMNREESRKRPYQESLEGGDVVSMYDDGKREELQFVLSVATTAGSGGNTTPSDDLVKPRGMARDTLRPQGTFHFITEDMAFQWDDTLCPPIKGVGAHSTMHKPRDDDVETRPDSSTMNRSLTNVLTTLRRSVQVITLEHKVYSQYQSAYSMEERIRFFHQTTQWFHKRFHRRHR